MELTQSLDLCKFCLDCKLTSLQDSILKLHKGAISNVQKHMKNCYSKEYQQLSDNWSDSLNNKEQKNFGKLVLYAKPKDHALQLFQQKHLQVCQ